MCKKQPHSFRTKIQLHRLQVFVPGGAIFKLLELAHQTAALGVDKEKFQAEGQCLTTSHQTLLSGRL